MNTLAFCRFLPVACGKAQQAGSLRGFIRIQAQKITGIKALQAVDIIYFRLQVVIIDRCIDVVFQVIDRDAGKGGPADADDHLVNSALHQGACFQRFRSIQRTAFHRCGNRFGDVVQEHADTDAAPKARAAHIAAVIGDIDIAGCVHADGLRF